MSIWVIRPPVPVPEGREFVVVVVVAISAGVMCVRGELGRSLVQFQFEFEVDRLVAIVSRST